MLIYKHSDCYDVMSHGSLFLETVDLIKAPIA